MPLREKLPSPNGETLSQLAGVTGVGWTTSILGFLTTVIGYGNSLISRFMADSRSFLYAGVVFFLMTVGLDRIANRLAEENERATG